MRATGSFEVTMKPLDEVEGDQPPGATLGRLLLEKTIAGDLVATTQGQMLTAMTPTQGSAGYVAIERVTGALHGREGSFVFQHSATMDRGAPSLSITVVPDSGTAALTGIRGMFTINIVDGKHFYEFEYSLPDAAPGAAS